MAREFCSVCAEDAEIVSTMKPVPGRYKRPIEFRFCGRCESRTTAFLLGLQERLLTSEAENGESDGQV